MLIKFADKRHISMSNGRRRYSNPLMPGLRAS
ncbi:Hypothetical protein Asd1617_05619 [Shigella dysenteriae 1617]|uniref:Uncharacterized protein n=1 Tax=Shigella dysenteriae 1617 TaxID=754093 RepID=A0A0A7A3H4_SHIDY|nr:Hypothetical protein Asd1617_05619 [Shigella dysenteriae 1617]